MRSTGAEEQSVGTRLAVVFSRFPVWNQTFALGDLTALERAGFRVEIFTLRGAKGAKQQPEAQLFQDRVHYTPLNSWALVQENLKVWCRPMIWRLLFQCISGTLARPVELLKTIVLFPQAVYFADLMQQNGIQHIHAEWASYPATAAWVASELTGLPFSFSAHAYDIYMVRSLLRQKIQRARFVVTCAETNRQTLVRVGGEEACAKIHLHRHGVDLERFHPIVLSPYKPQPVWQLLACGFLAPYKGFEHLVSACKLLRDQGYKFMCSIIGEGPERQRLAQQIRQAGLSSHVQLVDPMSQTQLAEQYHRADLFVHPSVVAKDGNRDVIPNVLIEAMASGIPVISTRLSGIQELIQEDKNGLLVSPGDPQALAEAISSLMQDNQKCEQFVEAAKRSVADAYDWRRNAEELIKTFVSHMPL